MCDACAVSLLCVAGQSELGHAVISIPDHNEHYSEVEVPNVPAKITFSFEFTDGEPDIRKFEVTKVESIH